MHRRWDCPCVPVSSELLQRLSAMLPPLAKLGFSVTRKRTSPCVDQWSRGTWEGKCPSSRLPSPLLSVTNQRVWLHFHSLHLTPIRRKTKLKKTIFCSHEIFSFGEPSGKHFQHTASEQLSCYRNSAGTEQGPCVGTTSYRRPRQNGLLSQWG